MNNQENYKDRVNRFTHQGNLGAAQQLLQQVIDSGQADHETWYLSAGIAGFQGRYELAEKFCRQALKLNDNYFEALFRLANSLDALNKKTEALEYYDKALALQPDFAHAWNNKGACLLSQHDYEQALACFTKAIQLDDKIALFHTNRGLALIGLGTTEELSALSDTLAATADNEHELQYFLTLLALRCRDQGLPEQALQLLQQVVALDDQAAENWLNLGLAQIATNQIDSAQKSLQQALALDPEHVEVNWTLAGLYLLQRNYAQGWPLYEYRWARKDDQDKRRYQPEWQGEKLSNKTLLIYPEQGFGDCIQFVRYLPLLQQQGARIKLVVPAALQRLFANLPAIDELIVSAKTHRDFDYAVSLGSLPLRCQHLTTAIPATVPYIELPAAAQTDTAATTGVPATTAQLRVLDGLRIAFVWAGNPKHVNDKNRSLAFAQLQPLLQQPGTHWISVQMGPAAAQLPEPGSVNNLIDLKDKISDFYDTAEILAACDLVLAVDTSVAHLAGAMNLPTWLLLPFAPDWRWGLSGQQSDWYPSIQLFRQPAPGDWASVIAQVQQALVQRLA